MNDAAEFTTALHRLTSNAAMHGQWDVVAGPFVLRIRRYGDWCRNNKELVEDATHITGSVVCVGELICSATCSVRSNIKHASHANRMPAQLTASTFQSIIQPIGQSVGGPVDRTCDYNASNGCIAITSMISRQKQCLEFHFRSNFNFLALILVHRK